MLCFDPRPRGAVDEPCYVTLQVLLQRALDCVQHAPVLLVAAVLATEIKEGEQQALRLAAVGGGARAGNGAAGALHNQLKTAHPLPPNAKPALSELCAADRVKTVFTCLTSA